MHQPTKFKNIIFNFYTVAKISKSSRSSVNPQWQCVDNCSQVYRSM